MLQTQTNKDRPLRAPYYTRDNYLNNATKDRYLQQRKKDSPLEITETESSYHYELKIPGFVKEDFYFYVSKDDLVVTTERSKIKETLNQGHDGHSRHSYCYPSAFYKKRIPLPKDAIRNEISVDYKNEVLIFDLLKSNKK